MKMTGLFAALMLLAGCLPQQYVEVTDVASGKKYLTTPQLIVQRGFSGAVQFHDLDSGKDVNLQSYETRTLSADEAAARVESSSR